MRQALHIFKKDVRFLWYEIAITLLVAAAFTFTGARQALWLTEPAVNRSIAWALLMFLLPLAWWNLIARVIHAEALPGDRQFWLTRPYGRKSLLGAKALFILVFVNLPMLIADAVIIRAYGFSPLAELPGLLWSQVLLTAIFVLPMAALSAITTGFLQLVLTIFLIALAVVTWTIAAPEAGLGAPWFTLDWVGLYYVIVVVTVAAVAIVAWQYARRRTAAARFLGAGAGILAILGTMLIPWTAVFAIQSRVSRQRIDKSSVHVAFDWRRKWAARVVLDRDDRVRINFPLQLTGIPDGMDARPDGLIVTLEAPDGTVWRADQQPWRYVSSEGQLWSLHTNLDGSFYRKVKDQAVKLRGSLYLTLYGNSRVTSVPVQDRPVRVPGLGVCSASRSSDGRNSFLFCRAAFRSMPALASYRAGLAREETLQPWVSYSPFPAEPGINPVTQYFRIIRDGEPFPAVAIDTVQPLAHIRRDFEIGGLRLDDFVTPTARGNP